MNERRKDYPDILSKLAVLDERTMAIDASVTEVKGLIHRQNGRIRALEVWRGFIVGAVSLLAFALATLAPQLWGH